MSDRRYVFRQQPTNGQRTLQALIVERGLRAVR